MENHIKENYLNIHEKFRNKYTYDWMSESFNTNDRTISTNGQVLVSTPKIDEFIYDINKIKNIYDLYPINKSFDKKIKLKDLIEIFNKTPLIEFYDEQEIGCDACDETGYVDFKFEYKSKEYTLEDDCPVCKGEGFLRIKDEHLSKELDYSKLIKIIDNYFNLKKVNDLIFICNILGEDIIHVVNQLDNYTIFQIGEIEIIMINSYLYENDEYFNINLY